ncbi:hypothetical protein ACROYT_G002319 [Oculina patagonica]
MMHPGNGKGPMMHPGNGKGPMMHPGNGKGPYASWQFQGSNDASWQFKGPRMHPGNGKGPMMHSMEQKMPGRMYPGTNDASWQFQGTKDALAQGTMMHSMEQKMPGRMYPSNSKGPMRHPGNSKGPMMHPGNSKGPMTHGMEQKMPGMKYGMDHMTSKRMSQPMRGHTMVNRHMENGPVLHSHRSLRGEFYTKVIFVRDGTCNAIVQEISCFGERMNFKIRAGRVGKTLISVPMCPKPNIMENTTAQFTCNNGASFLKPVLLPLTCSYVPCNPVSGSLIGPKISIGTETIHILAITGEPNATEMTGFWQIGTKTVWKRPKPGEREDCRPGQDWRKSRRRI